MAFQEYLAEEVAIDHADGMVSRREALRRLGLLGLGVPAASALLAACGGDGEPVSSTTSGAGQAATPPTPAVETEEITFPGPEGPTATRPWPSTCSRRRVGPPPSAARPRPWPRSPAPPRSGSWPT
jgi:carboxymethylenebutenolidase